MGGTGVPMRPSKLEGRAGKQGDGSSKTREATICAILSADGRDEKTTLVRDEGSISSTRRSGDRAA